LENVNLNEND
jgi:hypothetical protein